MAECRAGIDASTDDCIEWHKSRSRGYGQINTLALGYMKVHRLVWEEAHGPILDGLHVLHECDNRACYNIKHLFLGTAGDNIRDAQAKGRFPKIEHGTKTKASYCQCEKCEAVVTRNGPRPHGTRVRWNQGCRCGKCRKANADNTRLHYYKRQGRPVPPRRPPARHGSPGMYNYHGCRCSECREARNARSRKYARKKRLAP